LIVCNEIDLGSPNESIYAEGTKPFAAKSLTHDTILFLATCHELIDGGMSVLPTSISHFRASWRGRFDLPKSMSATSSRGKGCS
jgi:hypothetical protein